MEPTLKCTENAFYAKMGQRWINQELHFNRSPKKAHPCGNASEEVHVVKAGGASVTTTLGGTTAPPIVEQKASCAGCETTRRNLWPEPRFNRCGSTSRRMASTVSCQMRARAAAQVLHRVRGLAG